LKDHDSTKEYNKSKDSFTVHTKAKRQGIRPKDILKEIDTEFKGSRKGELDRTLLLKEHLRET